MIKPEIRIIAWDDCAFGFKTKRVRIVGPIFRGGRFMDGLLSTDIEKDGLDATDKIAGSVLSSRHYDQLSLVMLNGISFAGFNMVDIKMLNKKTKLPVIVVVRHLPDLEKFKAAMKKLDSYRKRLLAVTHAGTIYKYKNIFYQKSAISSERCEQIFKITCTQSNIPEPLRVAHLIASGLSRPVRNNAGYESKGRA